MEAWIRTKGEALWRASRTARQVLWGVFAAALIAALAAYQTSHAFPWETLWYNGVVLGVATVVAYYRNRPRVTDEDAAIKVGGSE